MTSRRQFLQIGIAATTTWPLASQAARATASAMGDAAVMPLYRVIYDERFADAVAFARQARARGARVQGIQGDVTSFWYSALDPRWRKQPVAIAGMTAHGALFCLERLAWERGMRVVFRAQHAPRERCVAHSMEGPAAIVRPPPSAAAGAWSDEGWAAHMAGLVLECPSGRTEIRTVSAMTEDPAAFDAEGDPLYTWIIAPAVKA